MRQVRLLCLTVVVLRCFAQDKTGDALDPDKIALESLFSMEVTTASKFSEKLSGAAGVMSVVTQDELRRFGAQTLAEALERVPGLTPTTSYFTDRQMVSVRGDAAKDIGSHVLLLINGRPMREPHDGGILSDLLQSLPVNAIERIEVIRGPGSVLYGTNAFSGVINVITKKARGQSITMRGAGVEDGGLGSGSGEVMFERGKLNLFAAVQARRNPPRRSSYKVPAFDPLLGPREPVQQLAVPDRGLGAVLTADYRGLRLVNGHTDWQSNSFVRGVVGEPRWRRGFTNLGYGWKVAPRWDMAFDVTNTRATFDVTLFPGISRRSSETLGEWSNVIRVTERDHVTFGALYGYVQGKEYLRITTPASLISNGRRHTRGFYGQLEHRFGDAWKLIGGFQSNKIGNLPWSTVPRAGAIWSPTKRVSLKTLYGRAFRSPSINEIALQHPGLSGNPNLRPEHVGTLDVSLSYQTDRTLTAVSWFDSRQTDVVMAGDVPGSAGPPRYLNTGSVKLRGIEAEAKYYLTDRWFVSGSLLHMQGPLQVIPSPVPLPVSRTVVTGAVSYQARQAFTFSLSSAIRSKVPQQGGSESLNPASETYFQVNSHARLELARWLGDAARGCALFAHGINLANQQMWFPVSVNAFADSVPFGRGRTIYYGLEVSLSRE